MNRRESFAATVAHREPERVLVDHGKHIGSFHRLACGRLRDHAPALGLPEQPVTWIAWPKTSSCLSGSAGGNPVVKVYFSLTCREGSATRKCCPSLANSGGMFARAGRQPGGDRFCRHCLLLKCVQDHL